MPSHVTTFWHLDTADPVAALGGKRTSDPGFARRLLSKLFPTTTVASIGDFPLNRSTSAGDGEIYIGSFPGLTVIQTNDPDPRHPTRTDAAWIAVAGAHKVLAFSVVEESGEEPENSAFAVWENGVIARSFSASIDRICEDEGVPFPFELPFWSGDFPVEESNNPLALPFDPAELIRAAQIELLGFEISPDGVDVPINGFATDGRRDVRESRNITASGLHLPPGSRAVKPLSAGGNNSSSDAVSSSQTVDVRPGSPYADDDYEQAPLVHQASWVLKTAGAIVRELGSFALTKISDLRKKKRDRS